MQVDKAKKGKYSLSLYLGISCSLLKSMTLSVSRPVCVFAKHSGEELCCIPAQLSKEKAGVEAFSRILLASLNRERKSGTVIVLVLSTLIVK